VAQDFREDFREEKARPIFVRVKAGSLIWARREPHGCAVSNWEV
jgi:hypothetical protein